MVAGGIPHCQPPLETLYLKDSMFNDKRLKLSIRVPAWKALSLNLGQYFSALCCKQHNGCTRLHYIISICGKLILPDCLPHSSGPHKAYWRGSSVKTNSLLPVGEQLWPQLARGMLPSKCRTVEWAAALIQAKILKRWVSRSICLPALHGIHRLPSVSNQNFVAAFAFSTFSLS